MTDTAVSRTATGAWSRDPGGFGLVELIVALTILSFGILALTGAAAVTQRSFLGAQAMEDGTSTAAVVIDSLMREPAPVAGERQQGRTRAQWLVLEDSVATVIDVTVTVNDGSGQRQLAFRAVHHAR
jgi:prepilin-type N-terminal cleavage/methylation domain-containing protein